SRNSLGLVKKFCVTPMRFSSTEAGSKGFYRKRAYRFLLSQGNVGSNFFLSSSWSRVRGGDETGADRFSAPSLLPSAFAGSFTGPGGETDTEDGRGANRGRNRVRSRLCGRTHS